ncbi:MAG: phenylacetate-CoA oxygenase subunit PaaJ [Pseudomonadota bacterium]|nr:phenylacetate-CoA oxygenase subunit PaaJ [Pseudomonadota bacterium]
MSDAVVESTRVESTRIESTRIDRAREVLADVLDPEVPVLSVLDLGLVRDVVEDDNGIEVVVTPTYSGCPATEVIERSIIDALEAAGLGPARVRMQRAPAWSSDWISAEGRRKLHAYGIVPPGQVEAAQAQPLRFVPRRVVALECPRCGSVDTERIAAFGATACKALWRCRACAEPFEHFKPI